jgi:hypothetical protein
MPRLILVVTHPLSAKGIDGARISRVFSLPHGNNQTISITSVSRRDLRQGPRVLSSNGIHTLLVSQLDRSYCNVSLMLDPLNSCLKLLVMCRTKLFSNGRCLYSVFGGTSSQTLQVP